VDLTRHDGDSRLGSSIGCRAAPARPTPSGCLAVGRRSPRVRTATLDPFRGYATRSATNWRMPPPCWTPFRWSGSDSRRWNRPTAGPQEQLGHRGRKPDPLYRIRKALRAADKLAARQIERIEVGLQAGDPHFEVTIAWRCYQQLRPRSPPPASSRAKCAAVAPARRRYRRSRDPRLVLTTSPSRRVSSMMRSGAPSPRRCSSRSPPAPSEIARLGRSLRVWRSEFLAYFTAGRASNGGTEAINGIIELHRRVARGFRNPCNYRLRMILAAGRLTQISDEPDLEALHSRARLLPLAQCLDPGFDHVA